MDRFTASNLRAYYGGMLTERQNEMLRLHYDEDLSFGEIAEMNSVSRQAVADAIKVGEKSLCEYEEKLGFVNREQQLAKALKAAENCIKTGDCEGATALIGDALKVLED